MPKSPGAYILIVDLDRPLRMESPSMKGAVLEPGTYAYCGSAHGPGGIGARVRRHLRRDKKPHWHIDRLTGAGKITQVHAVPGASECALLERILCLPGTGVPVPGFGSTDCRSCPAHLARAENKTALAQGLKDISKVGETC